eukprot:TRINITY_DN715_c0_g1_i1.p1 TRINITY_DN715_c0_g1~~TRINITY_DN715_c0_g1_i1.p1  ORF type:complete len:212 (+),score=32.84 TRINITY_DN715_c0_g1_i1:116-751(+)
MNPQELAEFGMHKRTYYPKIIKYSKPTQYEKALHAELYGRISENQYNEVLSKVEEELGISRKKGLFWATVGTFIVSLLVLAVLYDVISPTPSTSSMILIAFILGVWIVLCKLENEKNIKIRNVLRECNREMNDYGIDWRWNGDKLSFDIILSNEPVKVPEIIIPTFDIPPIYNPSAPTFGYNQTTAVLVPITSHTNFPQYPNLQPPQFTQF